MLWYSAGSEEAISRVRAAWPEAPALNGELLGMLLSIAREQVVSYAPAEYWNTNTPVLNGGPWYSQQDPPAQYVWAQLQHTKTLWNAGRVTSAGDVGGDGFSFAPRPLDKEIQRIIRPRTGVASVF